MKVSASPTSSMVVVVLLLACSTWSSTATFITPQNKISPIVVIGKSNSYLAASPDDVDDIVKAYRKAKTFGDINIGSKATSPPIIPDAATTTTTSLPPQVDATTATATTVNKVTSALSSSPPIVPDPVVTTATTTSTTPSVTNTVVKTTSSTPILGPDTSEIYENIKLQASKFGDQLATSPSRFAKSIKEASENPPDIKTLASKVKDTNPEELTSQAVTFSNKAALASSEFAQKLQESVAAWQVSVAERTAREAEITKIPTIFDYAKIASPQTTPIEQEKVSMLVGTVRNMKTSPGIADGSLMENIKAGFGKLWENTFHLFGKTPPPLGEGGSVPVPKFASDSLEKLSTSVPIDSGSAGWFTAGIVLMFAANQRSVGAVEVRQELTAQLEEGNQAIAALTAEVQSMRSEIQSLRSETFRLKDQLMEASEKLAAKELEMTKQRLEMAEKEHTMNEEMDMLRKQLVNANQNIKVLETEIAKASNKKDLVTVSKKAGQLEQELSTAISKLEELSTSDNDDDDDTDPTVIVSGKSADISNINVDGINLDVTDDDDDDVKTAKPAPKKKAKKSAKKGAKKSAKKSAATTTTAKTTTKSPKAAVTPAPAPAPAVKKSAAKKSTAAKKASKKAPKGSKKSTSTKAAKQKEVDVEEEIVEPVEPVAVKEKSPVNNNTWGELAASTLRRKSIQDLSDYLTEMGVSAVGDDGKPLKKADMVEAIRSL